MRDDRIIIEDIDTWPSDVLTFFKEREYVLQRDPDGMSQLYDSDTLALKRLLSSYSLHGYHCTRLTQQEILSIHTKGMSPQNGTILGQRIDSLVKDGLLKSQSAEQLKSDNLADEEYRKGMIWFCFFSPSIEANGVSRFFRSWGGEALYHGYEDGEIGQELRTIGCPCIIEAKVPVKNDSHPFLETKFTRAYMAVNGVSVNERSILHEGYTRHDVPPENILNIHIMPSPEFVNLSGNWQPEE